MNQHYLKQLEGLVIADVLSPDGDVPGAQHVLRIGDYSLTLLNRFQLLGVERLEQIVGFQIETVQETKDAVTIVLQNSIRIVVDLRDEACFGPEALVLHGPEKLIVVWN